MRHMHLSIFNYMVLHYEQSSPNEEFFTSGTICICTYLYYMKYLLYPCPNTPPFRYHSAWSTTTGRQESFTFNTAIVI